MNTTKWFTAVLLLSLCSNAFGVCSTKDLLGTWQGMTWGAGFNSLCTTKYRANGTVNSSASTCLNYFEEGGEPFETATGAGSVSVNKNCTIEGTFTGGTVKGILSRDGQTMVGVFLEDSTGFSYSFHDVKWK
jgi:hypothetical protein